MGMKESWEGFIESLKKFGKPEEWSIEEVERKTGHGRKETSDPHWVDESAGSECLDD